MPRIPLIGALTTGPIPDGTILLIEFTGASQWYNASYSIADGWLKQGGKVTYDSYAQSPDDIRFGLNRLGSNAEQFEKDGKVRIWDYYTSTLGQKSKERLARDSLKVADLSIVFSRDGIIQHLDGSPDPDCLEIRDNASTLARFNDERVFVEFIITRLIPYHKSQKSLTLIGILRGFHSGWVYEQLEANADGIIDLKLDDVADPPRNLFRIRSMRNVGFDGRWYPLKISENFEVTLEK